MGRNEENIANAANLDTFRDRLDTALASFAHQDELEYKIKEVQEQGRRHTQEIVSNLLTNLQPIHELRCACTEFEARCAALERKLSKESSTKETQVKELQRRIHEMEDQTKKLVDISDENDARVKESTVRGQELWGMMSTLTDGLRAISDKGRKVEARLESGLDDAKARANVLDEGLNQARVEVGVKDASFRAGVNELVQKNSQRIIELEKRIASLEHHSESINSFVRDVQVPALERNEAKNLDVMLRDEVRRACDECKAEARALVQALRDRLSDMCLEWRNTQHAIDGLRHDLGGDLVGDLERGVNSGGFGLITATKQDERKARCRRLSTLEDEQKVPSMRSRDALEVSTKTPSLNSNEDDKHSSPVWMAQNQRVEFDTCVLEPIVVAPQVQRVASPQLASTGLLVSSACDQHASTANQTSSAASLGAALGSRVNFARPPSLSSAISHMSPTFLPLSQSGPLSSPPARPTWEEHRRNKEALRAEVARVRFTDTSTYEGERLTGHWS